MDREPRFYDGEFVHPDDDFEPIRKRERFSYSQAAMRAIFKAASRAQPRLKAGEWRVLCAVIAYTLSYSKVSDRITIGVLAKFANLSPRHTGTMLRSLSERGLIGWEGKRGMESTGWFSPPKGARSTVRVPPLDELEEMAGEEKTGTERSYFKAQPAQDVNAFEYEEQPF